MSENKDEEKETRNAKNANLQKKKETNRKIERGKGKKRHRKRTEI